MIVVLISYIERHRQQVYRLLFKDRDYPHTLFKMTFLLSVYFALQCQLITYEYSWEVTLRPYVDINMRLSARLNVLF